MRKTLTKFADLTDKIEAHLKINNSMFANIIGSIILFADSATHLFYKSTTVPNKAGTFQNNLKAFSKERKFTDANYQRIPVSFGIYYHQSRIFNVCNQI